MTQVNPIGPIDLSHIAIKPPPAPSKYDIIPVHSSDRASFKFCRRQWAWGSPAKLNLVPRADVYGVNRHLWFGIGIHYALEQFYNPVLKRHPAEAWLTWFELQWRGGIVSEDEVKQFADRQPQVVARTSDGEYPLPPIQYKVMGLCDLLPDTSLTEEDFFEMKDIGVGMMNFYKDYAEANDNFTVISVEHDFSVPVLNSQGEPLYAIDERKMPEGWTPNFYDGNEFGPYMREVLNKMNFKRANGEPEFVTEKQVHVRGRMDMIQQDNEHGRYGITDFKTAGRIDEDYFRHLELDEQVTSYLSFGELEARIYNLEYTSLEYITYQAMLKGYPKPPTMTSKGLPSLDRQGETTTAELFAKCIKENGLQMVYDVDSRMQAYYTWLLEQGDKRFIIRTDTWRNHTQRINAMTRLYYEAQDMLNHPVCYPNPSKNYACLNCRFRTPCLQAETGDDYMQTLEDGYISNWDR